MFCGAPLRQGCAPCRVPAAPPLPPLSPLSGTRLRGAPRVPGSAVAGCATCGRATKPMHSKGSVRMVMNGQGLTVCPNRTKMVLVKQGAETLHKKELKRNERNDDVHRRDDDAGEY